MCVCLFVCVKVNNAIRYNSLVDCCLAQSVHVCRVHHPAVKYLVHQWILQVNGDKGVPTCITKNGIAVKHDQVQVCQRAAQEIMSGKATSSTANSKPIPAPRRKPDNSLRAGLALANNLESDDEIVEIRFEEDSISSQIGSEQSQNKIKSKKQQTQQQQPAIPRVRRGIRLNSSHRSGSIDLDPKTATIKRSMEELNRREQSEKEITRDLERQLAEIRKLEERQRNILQNTLRQVVSSVSDPQHATSSPRDERLINDNIDYASLLSPSFNRKTPLSSPMLSHRSVPSPQSPRKLSSSRRQDMQTINENGGYSISELGSMSPATSHRALSNMASPYALSRQSDPGRNFLGTNSLPVRMDRHSHQTYQDIASSSENLSEKNFRLSTSYSDLLPRADVSDRSGYFSDREAERRRIGDDVRAYTDEARRSLLQFEIEKRRKQVEENNQLRGELQRLIQSGSIPSEHYDRLRQMYKDHINRSREYLGMSNSSLSSIATSRSRGMYDTDSDITSSNEHLSGQLSQSSTVERFDQRSSLKSINRQLKSPSTPVKMSAQKAGIQTAADRVTSGPELSRNISDSSDRMQAMPLLEVRAPLSSANSPSGTELVTIGKSCWLMV